METKSAFLLQNSLSSSSFAGTLVAGDLPRVLLQKLPARPTPKLNSSNNYLKGLYSRLKQTSISLGPSTVSTMAVRSNASIDTDDQFDELFKKYGKVVYTNNDKKSSASEIDDDAESLTFAVAAAKVASDVKAEDIRLLFVKPLVYWTGFFIIATAFSRPQIDAICSKIRDLAEKEYGRVASGDLKPNSWTLLDFGDVVVHIFLPEQRAFYNLEEFYGNATPIKLPFDNQNSRSSNRMLNNSSMP